MQVVQIGELAPDVYDCVTGIVADDPALDGQDAEVIARAETREPVAQVAVHAGT